MNVYYLAAGPYAKIGKANNTTDRISQLQTACPEQIRKVAEISTGDEAYSFRVERAIHDYLRDQRTHGEWFKNCPRVAAGYLGAGRIRRMGHDMEWERRAAYGAFGLASAANDEPWMFDVVNYCGYGFQSEDISLGNTMWRACMRLGCGDPFDTVVITGYAYEWATNSEKTTFVRRDVIGYYEISENGATVCRFDGEIITWPWSWINASRAARSGFWNEGYGSYL